MTSNPVLRFFYWILKLNPTIDQSMKKPLKALIVGSLLAITYCIIFGVIFTIIGSWMVWLSVLYAILTTGFIYMLKQYGRGDYFIGGFSVLLISYLLIGVYNYGWACGFQFPLVSALVYAFLPRFKNLFYPIIVCIANLAAFFVGYYYLQHLKAPHETLSATMVEVMYFANVIVAFSALSIMAFLFEREAYISEQQVVEEKEKSEGLLHNILPVPIANRLKENPKIIADGFESVSVLFADIVGFTHLSTVFTPDQLVDYLNEIFSEFDKLAMIYEMEKIKTIGDAYMVSGGLPKHSPGHLERMADMALDMMKYVEKHKHEGAEKLEIRIGFHVGPVVAGVIGIKKFAYDLWGDTVNTASRMESQGMAGKVNVTKAVKEQLEHKFEFEERGEIEVKGKGKMTVYFLNGRKKTVKGSKVISLSA